MRQNGHSVKRLSLACSDQTVIRTKRKPHEAFRLGPLASPKELLTLSPTDDHANRADNYVPSPITPAAFNATLNAQELRPDQRDALNVERHVRTTERN